MTQDVTDPTLLTCAEMAAADAYTIDHGTLGVTLMERAGRGVADIAYRVWKDNGCKGSVLILCGPGNNGGDGYVVARRLAQQGIKIQVAALGDPASLKGDAATMRDKWPDSVAGLDTVRLDTVCLDTVCLDTVCLDGVTLIVDALFGAGLNRAIEGTAASLINTINAASITVIAVDMPSGLFGDGGRSDGAVIKADHTVTFHTKKPGHLLYPGRALCGQLHVVDIGINLDSYQAIKPETYENIPALWAEDFPQEAVEQHKYHRGHVMVLGGRTPALGASRLTALAALRSGSGLVTLMAPAATYDIQAAALDDVLVVKMESRDDFIDRLRDERITALALGPGAGVGVDTSALVLQALNSARPVVLDADALTSFAENQQKLFDAIRGSVVLTPHTGEFNRLFPDLDYKADKLTAARMAAKRSGAVVILKGADTVIASPCGRAAINACAPAHLSVGGTGDVLTGIVASLLGQGMAAFESACAAVWLHSVAADSYSRGMMASDLLDAIPSALLKLTKNH